MAPLLRPRACHREPGWMSSRPVMSLRQEPVAEREHARAKRVAKRPDVAPGPIVLQPADRHAIKPRAGADELDDHLGLDLVASSGEVDPAEQIGADQPETRLRVHDFGPDER